MQGAQNAAILKDIVTPAWAGALSSIIHNRSTTLASVMYGYVNMLYTGFSLAPQHSSIVVKVCGVALVDTAATHALLLTASTVGELVRLSACARFLK